MKFPGALLLFYLLARALGSLEFGRRRVGSARVSFFFRDIAPHFVYVCVCVCVFVCVCVCVSVSVCVCVARLREGARAQRGT